MSVLEKIRNKAGLLVVVIGGALLIFILQSALTSGRFFFGGGQNVIGIIAGRQIQYPEFNNKVQEAIANQEKNKGTNTVTDKEKNQIVQQTWNQMLSDIVMGKAYNNTGVAITKDELYDLMLGKNPYPYVRQYFTNHQTGRIIKYFADPRTGGLNMSKVLQYVQQMNSEQEADWARLEEAVKQAALEQKYFDLIKAGLYTTDAEAEADYFNENNKFNANYVLERYTTVPDKDVSVSESDLQNYYNKHRNDYFLQQKQETRKIDYVAFNITPTSTDTAYIKKSVDKLVQDFKSTKTSDDSAFVQAETDNIKDVDFSYHSKGTLSPLIDSIMFHSSVGTVYGPYIENGYFKVAKLMSVKDLPDSVKARHILLTANNGDYKKVMHEADSLKKILNSKNFAEMAKKLSKDQGSAAKGGELGWFTQGKMVPSFSHACFFGKKGDIVIATSRFGVHIIEIQDQSPKKKNVQVGIIEKNIEPSNQTLQTAYGKASRFAGKNNSEALFEKAAEQFNKRNAVVREDTRVIPGLESPRDLVQWAYKAKKGDVSGAIQLGNKFVVAHLAQITPKGLIALDQVKDLIKARAMKEKKAQKLIADIKQKMQGVSDINALAQKLNVKVHNSLLSFNTNVLPELGNEDKVIGVASAMKPNKLSDPIEGNLGVYVVEKDSVENAPHMNAYAKTKQQVEQNMLSRVQYDVYDALKDKADIVNHTGKFY